ncbi:MAG: AraC family transcriptional regulator [Rhizobiaceae bacterium]|nr:AraC family transcriptional regulator [Rhizobiaceae bacterium]
MLTQNDKNIPHIPVAKIFVDEALGCAHKANIDIEAMLAKLEINPGDIDHLNTIEFGKIWLELSYQMQDEFFGLGKRALRPGSTTLLGHAVASATTFEIYLNRLLRFFKVTIEEPYGLISRDDNNCIITLHETGAPNSAFAYRALFLIIHGFNCWAARERIPLKEVSFRCKEPRQINDYSHFFGVPVSFEAPASRIVMDQKFLSRKVRHSEDDLKKFLRTLPEAFLRGYNDADGLRFNIVQKCLKRPLANWPDSKTLAVELGMSRSTLHRRMKDAGLNLTELKDEERKKRVMALLANQSLSLSAIAEELGYKEQSSFYRAFTRWFNQTPSAFRECL